jgi:hypothetical protein
MLSHTDIPYLHYSLLHTRSNYVLSHLVLKTKPSVEPYVSLGIIHTHMMTNYIVPNTNVYYIMNNIALQ